MIEKKKVLITVKTYPTLSKTYDELVCTAGIDENGHWIRLYPVPFRKLEYETRYPKFSWIELDVKRKKGDFRPESYTPVNLKEIKTIGHVKPDGDSWLKRRKIVLNNVYTNLETLISDAKNPEKWTSLAVFKPKAVIDFIYKEVEREWDPETLAYINAKATQMDLFGDSENPFEVVKKLPYKFSYRFIDDSEKESTMMIEDWEIGQLYWNCLKRKGNEKEACEDVKKKYLDNFAKTKDLYLFLGTTLKHHNFSKNPFMIIGVFPPKPIIQPELDLF